MDKEFSRIFDLYYNDIYRAIYSYTLNANEAKDILQDTFMKFYENIEKLPKDDLQIKKWLLRVAANKSKDYLKSWWNLYAKVRFNEIININPKEYKELDLNILSNLQEKYRLPMYLYYYEGYKIDEIAYILRLNNSAVKMRLQRAKEKIKKGMER